MSKYPPRTELPPLGALCLDYTEDIHRPPGDPLNELSYYCPVIHEQVKNATVKNVVNDGKFSEDFVDAFADACKKLADRGAVGVITSCGFLAQVQTRLAQKSPIPVATSSLLQVPFVLSTMSPAKKVAVLTFHGEILGDAHFDGLGVITPKMKERLVVFGCKSDGHLRDIIVRGKPYVHEKLEQEMIDLAQEALSKDNAIGAFVFECTQMPPTSRAVQKATGLPVYDAITMIDWFYSGLQARILPEDGFKEQGLKPRKRSSKELL